MPNNGTVILFLSDIRKNAEDYIKGIEETNTLNSFYCPDLLPYLCKLSKDFLLWTNVMKSYFPRARAGQVSATARNEGYFQDLKKYDLRSHYQSLRLMINPLSFIPILSNHFS